VKRNKSRRLLPRYFSLATPEIEAIVAARQVIRLLRKFPDIPIYRTVQITPTFVEWICYCASVNFSVRILSNRLCRSVKELSLHQFSPSAPDAETIAFVTKEVLLNLDAEEIRFDELFVAEVLSSLAHVRFNRFCLHMLTV
jgi:hypothetical protein